MQQEEFVMPWWYDTLSRHVFKCMFLGPRQSPTSAVSWVTECTVWLSSFLTTTEKHMAAGCVRISPRRICLWHWHFISAGMSCVQTLKDYVTVCNRSRFEDALNACQVISLLFLLAILTKTATQEPQWKLRQPSESPLPHSWKTHQLVVYFFSYRNSNHLHTEKSISSCQVEWA